MAQIVPDATLGAEGSVITPLDDVGLPIDLIEGGATRSGNLFHSFLEFNIDAERGAYFYSPADIQNILARVTGANPSIILGLLGTVSDSDSAPNLFLINPNGMIFGENSRLDVEGSFVATTANAVGFGDRGFFSASEPQTPSALLTINPSAFFFNQVASKPIINQSIALNYQDSTVIDGLRVPDGRSLLLLGGEVRLDGGFATAQGGRIEIGGVSQPGTVRLNVDGNNLSLDFPNNLTRADVFITNKAWVNVIAGGGGSITIYGQNLTIDNSIVSAGIGGGLGSINTQTGDITLDATGQVKIGDTSAVVNAVFGGAIGSTGNINIKARSLQLTGGSGLGTFIFGQGQGNAGKVVVQAEDSVLITGNGTILSSSLGEEAVGQGGEVNIQTRSLSLSDSAQIGAIVGGRGNAGNILIQAQDSVVLAGEASIRSNVAATDGSPAQSQGGDINIQTRLLSLTDGADVSTSTFGLGDAGNVTVQAEASIVLVNGRIFSAVREGATGQGGKINIQAGSVSLSEGSALDSRVEEGAIGSGGDINLRVGSLSLTDNSVLLADTAGQGNAGNITVQANDFISLRDSQVYTNVYPEANGQAGNIRIQTGYLSLADGSRISNSTFGKGNAGSIVVQANDSISLIGDTSAMISGVAAGAQGNGGDIQIQANSLSLINGAQLFAATFGIGNSGNIAVNVSDAVNLSGVGSTTGFSSGFLTNTEEGATGQGGDIKVTTSTLRVSDGAVLSALSRSAFRGGSITVDANTLEVTNGGQLLTTAFSSGDAGKIMVNASDRVILAGSDSTFAARLAQFNQVDTDSSASGLFARTEGTGAAGNVTVSTPQLTVRDRAQVSVATSGGIGGSIEVTANSVQVTDGGQLSTTTAGSNNAGNITLSVVDEVNLAGAESGLFANTERGSSGNGGNIFISNPKTVVIRDGSSVAVDSKGIGEGGNIQIQAGAMSLNNQASISAETASNAGGNITLQVQDLLLMRQGSRISTTAGTAQAGGDGGNISIDAQFVVAVPKENSDITANAFTGRGGNINITTQGIYGLEFRPRLTPLSDITASSEFGVNGTVQINTPDVDPSRGLANLPVEPVNVEVAQGCQATGKQGSIEFFNTGRGGLASNPYEPLSSSEIWEDVPLPPQEAGNSASASVSPAIPPNHLVEAQGWLVNDNGEVTLVAEMPLPLSRSRCRLR